MLSLYHDLPGKINTEQQILHAPYLPLSLPLFPNTDLYLSLPLTHTHAHTYTLSLTHAHTHTLAHSLQPHTLTLYLSPTNLLPPPREPLTLPDYLDALTTVRAVLSALYVLLLEHCSHPDLRGMGSEYSSTGDVLTLNGYVHVSYVCS